MSVLFVLNSFVKNV